MSQYVREHWGIERGLPKGSIYAIAQTADGYLWIGTDEGLVRFDGIQFRLIRSQTELGNFGAVIGLAADRNGDLWIRLVDMTLLLYHDGKITNPLSGPERMLTVFSIIRGPNGGMLAAVRQQGVYTLSGGKFRQIANAVRMPRSPVLSLAATSEGSYWLGTRGAGLFQLKNGVTTQMPGLRDPKVNCLLPDGAAGLWIGTDSGIVKWNGAELTERDTPAELKPFQILALAKDRDANLWVGTDTGDVFRLNSDGLTPLDPGRKESGFAVTAIFEDREGSIWMGSANGLERLRDSAFVTYSFPEGVPADGSNPVFVDDADRMWFAPVTGGLWWWKDGRHGQVSDPQLDRDVIYSIAGAPGGLWLGRQRGGLTQVTVSGTSYAVRTLSSANGLAQNSAYSVYRDKDGNIWAGTLSGGVSKWDGSQFKTYTIAQGLASNTVLSIVETGRDMWFGTPNGLSRLSNGRWHTFNAGDGLPSGNVNCLTKDDAGTLWVGTNAGLAYLRNGRFETPAGAPPSLRDQILGVAQDAYGWLWVSTNRHVLRVRRSAVLEGKFAEGAVVEYGLADGLRGLEGVKRQHSVLADRKGRIWFSLNRGISMVDPGRLRSNSEPAKPKLQSITVDGTEMGLKGTPKFPAGVKRIVFGYTGLSLAVPERVRFKYRLSGFDHEWSKSLSDRQAEYTNLGPGSYTFHVVASNPDGVWSDTEASTAFTVDPAYWQSWWFRLGLLLLGVAAITSIYRLRLGQLTAALNMRFEERLAERTRIAQELHDTLLQGFLSASMQLYVAAQRIPEESPVKSAVLKTLELMNRVTEEGRNAVRGLRGSRSKSQDLKEAFSRMETETESNSSTSFRVVSHGEHMPLHPVLQDEVYRIGREAILNAFRHAEATQIEAELNYSSRGIRLTVRDDGRGIEPQTLRSGKDGHWGLSGMRERADRIGARLRLSSTPQGGTEVELTVPAAVAFQNRNKEITS